MKNLLPDIIQDEARERIVVIATTMLQKGSDIIKAAREIKGRIFTAKISDDPLFTSFIRFTSDIDHIPTEFNPAIPYEESYLKKLKKEREESIAFYKAELLESCTKIIEKFANK